MIHRIHSQDIQELISKYSEKAVFWKDIHSNYIACNRFYAQKCGFSDLNEIVGLNDLVINPQFKELYLHDDQSVIFSKSPKHLYNPAFYPCDGKVFVEGILSPVFDNHERISGVLGILEVKANVLSGSFISVLNFIRNNNVADFLKENRYFIDQERLVSLSKNELACYFYAEFLNLSSKQISSLMSLSPRTVEKYLERAREKKIPFSTHCFNNRIQELILQSL